MRCMNSKVYFWVNENIVSPYVEISFSHDDGYIFAKFTIPKYKLISMMKSKFIFTYAEDNKNIYIDKIRDMIIIHIDKTKYTINNIDEFIYSIRTTLSYLYYRYLDIPTIYKAIRMFIYNEELIDYIIYRIMLSEKYSNLVKDLNSSNLSEMRYIAMLVEAKIINTSNILIPDIIDQKEYKNITKSYKLLFANGIYTIDDGKKNFKNLENIVDKEHIKCIKSAVNKFIVLGV